MSRPIRELVTLSLLLVARLLIDGADIITFSMRFTEELISSIGGVIWPARLVVAVLPLVGYALAALLVAGGLPRVTMLVGIAMSVGASACGLAGVSFYSLVGWNIARGLFGIGLPMFAASLVGGEPPTTRRFAALTAFLLLRDALRGPTSHVFLKCFGPYRTMAGSAFLVSIVAELIAAGALVVAAVLVVDRAPEDAAPRPGVWQLGTNAEPAPPPAGFPFGLLALLLLPAIVLELDEQVTRFGDKLEASLAIFPSVFRGVAALYFAYGAVRRLPLTPMKTVGGLMIATGPCVAAMIVSLHLWELEAIQAFASLGQQILFAYAVLAARGRAGGAVVVAWLLATSFANAFAQSGAIFGVTVAVLTLIAGGVLVWRGRGFHAALEVAGYSNSTSKFS